ncbi:MAG: hypothetical protein HOO96_09090 [Polyangiaceae bacterium]|nr:hypothetical protein [Polyangiaceae bacterium]
MSFRPSAIALAVFAATLVACNATLLVPDALGPLTAEMKTTENLSLICGRPIDKDEASTAMVGLTAAQKNQPGTLEFTNPKTLSSSRQDGHATVDVMYRPKAGAPCNGTMTFDFHVETTEKRYTRKQATYSSKYDLTNVIVAKR